MIKDIFRENRLKIGLIYIFLIIQYTLTSLTPYLTGKAIDSLLRFSYSDLFIFLANEGAVITIGVLLKRFDTRVFMSIFTSKASQAIEQLRLRKVVETKILSRYHLVRTYSDFFEFSIPQILNAIISAATALVMIMVADYSVGAVVSGLFLLMVLNNRILSYKIQKIDKDIQFRNEEINQQIISSQSVSGSLIDLGKSFVRKSDLDAVNFFFNDLLGILMTLSVMFMLLDDHPTIGMIAANVLYVQRLHGVTYNIFYFFMFMRSIENTNDFLNAESDDA